MLSDYTGHVLHCAVYVELFRKLSDVHCTQTKQASLHLYHSMLFLISRPSQLWYRRIVENHRQSMKKADIPVDVDHLLP